MGCAFVPRVSSEQAYALQCKLFTRNLDLELTDLELHDCHDTNELEACLVVYGVIAPVLTFFVSGSIVLAGNTVHWLEYQGRCDESEFSKQINRLKEKISNKFI